MVSDKVLVKQLQREVARLEAELAAAPSVQDFEAQTVLVQEVCLLICSFLLAAST